VSYESIEKSRRKIIFTVIIILLIIPLIIFGTIHTFAGNYGFGIVDLFLALLFGGFIVFINKTENPIGVYRTTCLLLVLLLGYWLVTGAVNGYASMWVFVYPLISFFLTKSFTITTLLFF